MSIETPKGTDMEDDRRNLALLRSMDMIPHVHIQAE
jgi:hypothetical protein